MFLVIVKMTKIMVHRQGGKDYTLINKEFLRVVKKMMIVRLGLWGQN